MDADQGVAVRQLAEWALRDPAEMERQIPITYVPARNTIFLSFALAWAEVIGANDIFIGVNALDYSGYPDCRPEYIEAFERLAGLATRAGVEGAQFHVHAPLIRLSKAEIIREGTRLGVDYGLTVSCYQADAEGQPGEGELGHCGYRRVAESKSIIYQRPAPLKPQPSRADTATSQRRSGLRSRRSFRSRDSCRSRYSRCSC